MIARQATSKWVASGLLVAVAFFATQTANYATAAVYTWNVDSAGNWSDTTKWDNSGGGTYPSAAGDTASLVFDITAARTVTIDTAAICGILNINDTGVSPFSIWTLAASGPNALTLNNSGNAAQINILGNSNSQKITTPIILQDNLAVSASGGTATFSGQITGAQSITTSGPSGAYFNNGTSTYSGGTAVSSGTLGLGADSTGPSGSPTQGPIGTGALTIDGGTVTGSGTTAWTVANQVYVNGNFAFRTVNSAHFAALTLSGPISLNSTSTITVNNGSTAKDVTLSGAVSGAAGNNLTKAGLGTLVLSGANNYDGTTTVDAGFVVVKNSSALGSTAGGTTVGSSGIVKLDGSAGDLTIGDAFSMTGANNDGSSHGPIWNTAGNNTLTGLVTVTEAGSSRISVSGGSLTSTGGVTSSTASSFITTATSGASATYQGTALSLGTATFVAHGAGTVNLNVAGNTFAGAQATSNSTLKLGVDDALPTASYMQLGSGVVSNSGSLDLNGHNQTLAYIVGAGGGTSVGTVTSAAVGTLTIGDATARVLASNNVFTGAGLALTKVGAGSLKLDGTNTYGGVTTVSNGTLTLGTTGDIAADSVIKVANGAIYEVDVLAGQSLKVRDVRSELTGSGLPNLKAWIEDNASIAAQLVSMEWRERSSPTETALLASNVLTYTQPTTPLYYVLAMQYDQALLLGGLDASANIAWNNGGVWTPLGMTLETNPANLDAWGDYLIDAGNNTVYLVTNLNASSAVEFAVVPEPGTLALLATGLLGLIAYAWRKRK